MIYLGSDHAGYALKAAVLRELASRGVETTDLGCYEGESADYPDIAAAVCDKALEGNTRGILVCGSGVGISMAANKIPGIRCALCTDAYMARFSRLHNDANVLALGGRVLGEGAAMDIVDAFLNTSFEGGRHAARVKKINALDKLR